MNPSQPWLTRASLSTLHRRGYRKVCNQTLYYLPPLADMFGMVWSYWYGGQIFGYLPEQEGRLSALHDSIGLLIRRSERPGYPFPKGEWGFYAYLPSLVLEAASVLNLGLDQYFNSQFLPHDVRTAGLSALSDMQKFLCEEARRQHFMGGEKRGAGEEWLSAVRCALILGGISSVEAMLGLGGERSIEAAFARATAQRAAGRVSDSCLVEGRIG